MPTTLSTPLPDTRSRSTPALQDYRRIRRWSLELCRSLETEDFVVQSMPDVSPTKWHLAHTTWFFETFVLERFQPDFQPFDPAFRVLFNSYYNAIGEQFSRPRRGLLSRPTVARVFEYRENVDRRMEDLLENAPEVTLQEIVPLVEVGLQHEQQHQELMLTDLKHVFSINPLFPVFRPEPEATSPAPASPLEWTEYAEDLYEIGHQGGGFAYDNESPRHRIFLEAFALASRPVTCGEMLEFMADGGYERPELWLSAGWSLLQETGWRAPAYWVDRSGRWEIFTLSGLREVREGEPVCHVSYFEADAYARWAGARLPLEGEWEVAARGLDPQKGHFVEDQHWHPEATPADASRGPDAGLSAMFGDVWEWTASPYSPYPGFDPPSGALGEYNGKFMCNQMVLRGGSCATPRGHVRATYRNFFPPDARWQFSGLRLAR